MKSVITAIALNLLALSTARSQAPVFSQFYTSPMFLNPALSGLEKDLVLGVNYRTQWAGVNVPFRTFQFSCVQPIIQEGARTKQLGAVAASAFSDEEGPNREMTSRGFSFASSYDFHLDRTGNHLLAAALQFGVLQRRINADALHWSSQYSPALGYDASLPGETLATDGMTTPVINAGLVWQLVVDNLLRPVHIYYQGIAFSNLNRPKGFFADQHEPASILVKVHGGYVHTFQNGFEISPNYLIQYQKGMQINIGGYGAYSLQEVRSQNVADLKVSLGFWYRIRDSFIVTTGISTSSWSAGISYDANTSSLESSFPGANAFELSLSYRFSKGKEYRNFSSPIL